MVPPSKDTFRFPPVAGSLNCRPVFPRSDDTFRFPPAPGCHGGSRSGCYRKPRERPSTHPYLGAKSVPASPSCCPASSQPSISSSTGPSQRGPLFPSTYTGLLNTQQKLVCFPALSVSPESKETEQRFCVLGSKWARGELEDRVRVHGV